MSAPSSDPAPTSATRTRDAIALAVLFLVALALRLAGAGWGLPQLYEEAMPLKVAWRLWAWDEPGGFRGDPHTLGYPSLMFYVHFAAQAALFAVLRVAGEIRSAADFRLLYALDKTSFALAGRAITALFGAALVPATFALARRLAGRPAAWAAAVLAALVPALVVRSTEIEVDVPLACFVTWGIACAMALLERPHARTALVAGVAVGLAGSTKYPGLVLVVPCLAAVLLAPRSRAPGPTAAPAGPKRRRAEAARRTDPGPPSRVRLALVLLVAAAAVFAITSPYVILDRAGLWRDLVNHREHMARGHFGVESGPAFGYNAQALFSRLLGPVIALLALVGVARLAGVERRRDAIVAASLPIAYLGFIGTWTMKADRYLLLVVPVAIAFAMAGAAWLLARVPARRDGPVRALSWGLVALACAVPFVPGVLRGESLERFRPDTRTEALRWFQANVPEGAFVVVESLGPELADFTAQELVDEVARRKEPLPHRPRFYAVQHVPMFQVDAERSSAFYDLAQYGAADLFVVSGAVRSRYQGDARRYAAQCAFYDSLERTWSRVAAFPSRGHAGPDLAVYRNPRHAEWFPSRRDVPGPVSAGASNSGGENYFYWNLGVNYETGDHFDRAAECYRIALRYAPLPGNRELYASIATRLVYCRLRTIPPDRVLAELHDAEQASTLDIEREVLRWVAGQLLRDPAQFQQLAIPRPRA